MMDQDDPDHRTVGHNRRMHRDGDERGGDLPDESNLSEMHRTGFGGMKSLCGIVGRKEKPPPVRRHGIFAISDDANLHLICPTGQPNFGKSEI